ncbi:MAG TPA: hypothetical protein VGJ59_14690 [Jatrophihabitantaceae bacterium]
MIAYVAHLDHGAALPGRGDHRTQRGEERGAPGGDRQAAERPLQVRHHPRRQAQHAMHAQPSSKAHGRPIEQRPEQQRRAGDGSRTQHRVHPFAQPAAGYEHQPLHLRRVVVRDVHRNGATQRVADKRGPRHAEGIEQVAHAVREAGERVLPDGADRLVGCAVPEQVRRNDPHAPLSKRRGRGRPRAAVGHQAVHQHHDGTVGRPRVLVAQPVPGHLDGSGRHARDATAPTWA